MASCFKTMAIGASHRTQKSASSPMEPAISCIRMYKSQDILKVLLILCLVTCNCHYVPYSTQATQNVEGRRGGNVTLLFDFRNPIFKIILMAGSKEIGVCQREECQVSRNGSLCAIIKKDLKFSDGGACSLNVYRESDQPVVAPQVYYYQLHIYDEISVNEGENLTLDIPLLKVNEVQHEHEPLWRKGEVVQSKQLIFRNGNLNTSNVTQRNAGRYTFLDSKNNTLITVTIKVNGLNKEDPGEKLGVEEEKQPENRTTLFWIILPFSLIVIFLIVAKNWSWSRNDNTSEPQRFCLRCF